MRMAKSNVPNADGTCPECGGDVYDNREKKASGQYKANGPDFACKDKDGCAWKGWPPRQKGQGKGQGGGGRPAPPQRTPAEERKRLVERRSRVREAYKDCVRFVLDEIGPLLSARSMSLLPETVQSMAFTVFKATYGPEREYSFPEGKAPEQTHQPRQVEAKPESALKQEAKASVPRPGEPVQRLGPPSHAAQGVTRTHAGPGPAGDRNRTPDDDRWDDDYR